MKIMSLTDAAAERIREIMEDADKPVIGVRVGVKNAGCAGMAYTLDYVSEPPEGDDHVNDKGLDVWVEPKATLFLLGTVMDFKVDKLSESFTFRREPEPDRRLRLRRKRAARARRSQGAGRCSRRGKGSRKGVTA